MLIGNPLTGYSPVVAFLLLAEWVFLALFLWELSMSMQMLDTLVTSVSLSFGGWMEFHLGFFEQAKVVSSAMTEIRAYDPKRSRLGILVVGQLRYDELGFESMTLLFARVIAFLSFFGRSTGDSEASTKMTSYSASLLRRALRPGREKRLSFTRVSSTHLHIL